MPIGSHTLDMHSKGLAFKEHSLLREVTALVPAITHVCTREGSVLPGRAMPNTRWAPSRSEPIDFSLQKMLPSSLLPTVLDTAWVLGKHKCKRGCSQDAHTGWLQERPRQQAQNILPTRLPAGLKPEWRLLHAV